MKEKQAKKSGPSKKEIRTKIQESVNKAIGELHVEHPSKKVRRVVRKTSKAVAKTVKKELKVSKPKKTKRTKKLNGNEQAAVPIV